LTLAESFESFLVWQKIAIFVDVCDYNSHLFTQLIKQQTDDELKATSKLDAKRVFKAPE